MCPLRNVTKKNTITTKKGHILNKKTGKFPLDDYNSHSLRGTWVGFHGKNSPLKTKIPLKSHPTSGVLKVPLSAGTTSGVISSVTYQGRERESKKTISMLKLVHGVKNGP